MPEPAKDTRCESPASLTSSEGSANEESAKLMIRNIYPKVTDDMLKKILIPFGELKSVEIAMKGKESRGYGYAEVRRPQPLATASLLVLRQGSFLANRSRFSSSAWRMRKRR